jgi:hypothetical protein
MSDEELRLRDSYQRTEPLQPDEEKMPEGVRVVNEKCRMKKCGTEFWMDNGAANNPTKKTTG